jgi:hypothetical protein
MLVWHTQLKLLTSLGGPILVSDFLRGGGGLPRGRGGSLRVAI